MKKHAIIPVFIPHLGCPHACVFCDQNQITARSKAPSKDEVISFVDTWLTTLDDVDTVELAFYGGSFTAIPIDDQNRYLEIAKSYKDAGKISKIHLSTRPDAINKEILDNLKSHSVDTIELGVQSFDDRVLEISERGHDSVAVYKAAELIKERGMELGIQLMIGLPGDSYKSCVYSAEETIKLKPSLARLYPTLVLPGTKLYDMYERGEYTPLTREEAVMRTATMYRLMMAAGIYIMRVGLKSTDVINSERLGEINSGTYHPAFRQLVEDYIAREKISSMLNQLSGTKHKKYIVKAAPSWASSLSGHNGENKAFFNKEYPDFDLVFATDESIAPGKFTITTK
ncbi:MAG: radical SAM protein [Firmicutes bacterium]|nr:radical SAM protein [Bacillota bacterium]